MADTILIIDDDIRLSAMLRDYLEGNGFAVQTAANAKAGLAAIARHQADAVILDVMLPDLDGFEVLRRIRTDSDVPVLMLTAKGEETDRIVGLEIGADDYLPKPFSARELLARLRAILRRRSGGTGGSGVLRFGRLEIDPGARGPARWPPLRHHRPSVRYPFRPGRKRRADSVARPVGRSGARHRWRRLRPLDRCSHLAHPRRH